MPSSPSAPVKINVPGNHLMVGLLGQRDELLRLIEAAFPETDIRVRGNEITVEGQDTEPVARLFEELVILVQRGHALEPAEVVRTIEMIRSDERPSEVLTAEVLRGFKGRTVRAKSSGQKRYVDAIRDNIITIGIGPAGTGKSWLAVATAVQALQEKEVERIILTRPAVEAGERLGFLPGDMMAKIDPYLRPLYDALFDMVGAEGAERLIERGTVEVAPLAFMRGRTLNGSFIILDEAQNTSPEQMKMFLTRIGFGSKAVITGDTTQVDVQHGRSGLEGLERILTDVDGLAFVRLGSKDVVRHRIVQDIVDAYDKASVQVATRVVTTVPAPVVVARDDEDDEPVDVERWSELAAAVLAEEGVAGELNLLFVDEAAMAELNQEHMGHEGPTDVLSFPIDGPDAGPDGLLGDVVVCPAVARRNAPDHAGTYEDELALLVVHGVLHVLGHDHAEDDEAALMRTRERFHLERFGS